MCIAGQTMRIAVIIVNFRTPHLVHDCLRSLASEIPHILCQVVVVDNNSGDGSVKFLQKIIENECWMDWVTILPQKHNLGFAAGNNAAVRHILEQRPAPDFFLLLNPDTRVCPNALKRLANFLDSRPEVGIVGALLEDDRNIPQSSARRFPTPWSELDAGARLGILTRLLKKHVVPLPPAEKAHRCDWVSGAAMMIRRQIFKQVGFMDEDFFLYFEEVDFCQRVASSGWQIWLEPSARIVHLEGSATCIRQTRSRRGHYWYDSRRHYFIKHHGIKGLLLADFLWGAGRFTLIVRRLIGLGGNNSSDPIFFASDLLLGDFYFLFRCIFKRLKTRL